nr:gene transfer agent family protein [uncultured Sphingomonas sp.]
MTSCPTPTPPPKGRGFESANPHRGEASLMVGGEVVVIRPSFAALVAAEEELGPLFALVERAAEGKLSVGEIAALFDHLSRAGRAKGIDRVRIGEAIVEQGLAGVTPQLRQVLGQILQGR